MKTQSKTYLTQKTIGGKLFAGPRIRSSSWAKAGAKAQELGVEVIGVLNGGSR